MPLRPFDEELDVRWFLFWLPLVVSLMPFYLAFKLFKTGAMPGEIQQVSVVTAGSGPAAVEQGFRYIGFGLLCGLLSLAIWFCWIRDGEQ